MKTKKIVTLGGQRRDDVDFGTTCYASDTFLALHVNKHNLINIYQAIIKRIAYQRTYKHTNV